MPGSALLPARNAVYAALKADAPLDALAGIYQTAPDNSDFPYIDIASATESIDDTFAGTNSNGREVTLTINCWSEEKQDDEINVIYDKVVDILNWSTLSLSGGWVFTSINLENTNSRLSEDYRQISARFRLRCCQ